MVQSVVTPLVTRWSEWQHLDVDWGQFLLARSCELHGRHMILPHTVCRSCSNSNTYTNTLSTCSAGWWCWPLVINSRLFSRRFFFSYWTRQLLGAWEGERVFLDDVFFDDIFFWGWWGDVSQDMARLVSRTKILKSICKFFGRSLQSWVPLSSYHTLSLPFAMSTQQHFPGRFVQGWSAGGSSWYWCCALANVSAKVNTTLNWRRGGAW